MENRLVGLLLLLSAHFYWLTTIDYLSILLEFKCIKLTSGNQTIFNKYDMPYKDVDICNLFALRDMLLSAKKKKKEENNFDFFILHFIWPSIVLSRLLQLELYSINFLSQYNFCVTSNCVAMVAFWWFAMSCVLTLK